MSLYIRRCITKKRSIADARKDLPQLIRDAEAGEPIELTRHGVPVAMIISCDSYERLALRRPTFSEAYEEFTSRFDLAELDIDPDEIFGGVRDDDPGRDVKL